MIKEISAAEKGKGLGQTPSSKGLGGGNSTEMQLPALQHSPALLHHSARCWSCVISHFLQSSRTHSAASSVFL